MTTLATVTTDGLEALRVAAILDLNDVKLQLERGQTEETTRALLRTKNERMSQLQELNIELSKRAETYPKSFERSLNEETFNN